MNSSSLMAEGQADYGEGEHLHTDDITCRQEYPNGCVYRVRLFLIGEFFDEVMNAHMECFRYFFQRTRSGFSVGIAPQAFDGTETYLGISCKG